MQSLDTNGFDNRHPASTPLGKPCGDFFHQRLFLFDGGPGWLKSAFSDVRASFQLPVSPSLGWADTLKITTSGGDLNFKAQVDNGYRRVRII
jgi:hypothetical protein